MNESEEVKKCIPLSALHSWRDSMEKIMYPKPVWNNDQLQMAKSALEDNYSEALNLWSEINRMLLNE